MKPKILTVTLNPALDEIVRGKKTMVFPGGKGVNVSRALKALGVPSRCLVAVAGASGRALVADVREEGLRPVVFRVKGETRINTTTRMSHGALKRVMGQGPVWNAVDVTRLRRTFARCAQGQDVVIFSGSLPTGIPEGIYATLVREATRAGALVFLDTSAGALGEGIKAKPFGVKPNQEEAESLLGQRIVSRRDVKKALQSLVGRGMKRVVLTLASQGLAVSDGVRQLLATGPRSQGHGVGSGDAALAGYVAGMLAGLSLDGQAGLAAAAGGAAASMDRPAGIDQKTVMKILKQVKIIEL